MNKRRKYIVLAFITLICVIGLWFAFDTPFVYRYDMEAGNELLIDNLLKKEGNAEFVSCIDESITNKVGTHTIEAKYNDKIYKVKISVKDTIMPEIEVKSACFYVGDKIDVYQFIDSYKDKTQVTFTLEGDVNTSQPGEYTVSIKAEDEGGNVIYKEAILSVVEDHEPPLITISSDIYIIKDESVSFRKYITVKDNRDGIIDNYMIDSSDINMTKEGTYTLTVSASDLAGNQSKTTGNVYVVGYDIEKIKKELKTYASKILDSIIDSSMSRGEKMKAVYNYVTNSYTYQGYHDGDIENYYYDAYYGFKNRKGDCYVVNAMARYLLESLDIKTYGYIVKGKSDTHIFYAVFEGDQCYYYSALRRSNGTRIYRWSDKQVLDYLRKWDGVTKLPELKI